MNRFIDHFHHRIPLSAAAEQYIRQHGKVRVYDRLTHFMTPGTRAPYWCAVLEGLVCGYTLDARGQRRIRWFASEMQGFAGVRHLHTPKPTGHYIQFTEITTILCIPALRMREGKERFPEVSELLHIMNQRYRDRQDLLVQVLQQPSPYERFASFVRDFPDLARLTTPDQQMDFINITRPTYYRALKRYWKENRK